MKKMIFALIFVLSASLVISAQDKKESQPKEKSEKEYIADLSADKDEASIVAAADYVGKNKVKDAVNNCVGLLGDSRELVRAEAAAALGYIGEESAVDALNKTLLEDSSAIVRYTAILASVRIGSKKSIDSFKKAYETDTDPFIKDFLQKYYEKVKK